MTVLTSGFGSATLIASVGGGALGNVRVVIPGEELPVGLPWELRGLSGETDYRVRGGSGVGEGEQVVLVDPGAPLNTVTTYQLYVDGAATAYVDVSRSYAGRHVLASLDGGTVVDFEWTARGGDQRQGERRYHASPVPGRARPPLRLAPVAGDGGGSLEAWTVQPHTSTLRGLLASNRPCYLFHNEGICDIPGCDIPLVELVYVTSAGNDRTGHVHEATRSWSLGYLLVDDPEPDYRVGLSTWDEFDAAVGGMTWDEFDAVVGTMTWDQWARTDWTQVGS